MHLRSFKEKAAAAINAEIRMISGCEDVQTSDDVANVGSFNLPDPAGRAGGACTSALLSILYADKKSPDKDLSFKEVLLKMRIILDHKRFEQIPQLSSSRELNIDTKFDITPDGFLGIKRAVLIGINYVGHRGALSGCHNDVLNMKEYLMDVHGIEEDNMTILMDDGAHQNPTKENMLNAYQRIAEVSQPGDCVFCHYSGHGGNARACRGEGTKRRDETLVPVDFQTRGQIRDDDILKTLVLPMKEGVFVTCLMDCCHSGTVLDLPYTFKADGKREGIQHDDDFNFDSMTNIHAWDMLMGMAGSAGV